MIVGCLTFSVIFFLQRFEGHLDLLNSEVPARLTRGSVGSVSVTFHSALRKLNTEPSYQVLVHIAKQFQRRRLFRNRPIRNKNCMWWHVC